MRSHWLASLAVLGLLAVPVLAQKKDDPKSAPPSLIIRLAPIDELLADAKYIGSFTEFDETVKQLAGLVDGQTDKKGLRGIDPKKPIGLYAYLKENLPDSQAVVMLPILDEKTFLATLEEKLNLKPEKGKDDVYTVQLPQVPFPAMFRFANDYCYITAVNDSAIAKDKLAMPAQMLPAGQGILTTVFRIDQVPDTYKQLVLQQFDLQLADAIDKAGGQTDLQKAFAKQLIKQIGDLFKDVVTHGEEVSLKLDVDRKANKLSAELSLAGKTDTKLSGLFNKLGKAESLFGSLTGGDSAFLLLLNVALPEDLRKSFNALLDESIADALKKETDAKRKAQTEKILKALDPSFKAGEMDVAFDLRRAKDAKNYTLVLGGKVRDGSNLDKAIKEVIKEQAPDDQKRIKLDVAESAGTKIHMVEVSGLQDENAKKMFGDGPGYFAVRGDAVVVFGENALSTIKEVLAAKPKSSPQTKVVVRLTALAPALAQAPGYDKDKVEKAAKEAFEKDKDADKITVLVEGGKTLKLRYEMDAPAIKFFAQMYQMQK